MDESLFLMMLLCGFLLLAGIIYCFLSTCLGLQIRRSDIWEAFSPSSILASNRHTDRERRARAMVRGEYEMDTLTTDLDTVGSGMGGEEMEMRLKGGPGRFY